MLTKATFKDGPILGPVKSYIDIETDILQAVSGQPWSHDCYIGLYLAFITVK
jgi:hypothetical protein